MQPILRSTLKHLSTVASGIGRQKKLLILIYHRVLDEPDFMRPDEIDKEIFLWHMDLISNYFNVLPLNLALERMREDSLPSRAVCITFDDGYADNLYNATPILLKNNITATFFIASDYLDGGRMWNDSVIEAVRKIEDKKLDLRKINLGEYGLKSYKDRIFTAKDIIQKVKYLDPELRQNKVDFITSIASDLPTNLMLTTNQLQKLNNKGMEIGGHTLTHPILSNLAKRKAEYEIVENKKVLESIINKKINYFAYPNGKPSIDYLPEHIEMLKHNGYRAGLSTGWGVASKKSDIWQLPRFTPWDTTPQKFFVRLIRIYSNLI